MLVLSNNYKKDIKNRNSVITMFSLLVSCLLIVILETSSDGYFENEGIPFFILFLIAAISNSLLSNFVFNNEIKEVKNFVLKLFVSTFIMFMIIPIGMNNMKENLTNTEIIEFNQNLSKIIELNEVNIYQKLDNKSKEKYEKNLKIIRDNYKDIKFPLVYADLFLTKKILNDFKDFKFLDYLEKKEIEKETVEITKRIK